MKELLSDIMARLLATVPALKYVDEDWGQLDYYAPHPPVQWPACLIDVSNAQWQPILDYAQKGVVQVRLRLATVRLSNSSGAAPATQRANAWAIYDIMEAVHQALHGWSGSPLYSKLIRASTSRVKREDGVTIYEVIYTCELTDISARPVRATTTLAPVLVVQPPL